MILPLWIHSLIEKVKNLRNDAFVSKVLGGISVIYPLALIYFSRREILSLDWGAFLRVFLISLLIYYISMSLQNIAWSLMLDGNLTNYWFNSKVYFQTVLMKRLPGGVWHWLGRANIYEVQGGDEKNSVTRANLTEWLVLILSGLSGYAFTLNPWFGFSGLMLTVVVAFLLFRKGDQSWESASVLAILLVMIYVICWLVGGLLLQWLLSIVINPEPVSFRSSLGIWCLSSSIGMFFFFFPSGGLIRDFSMSALLSKQYETAKFLLVILQVRIIFLAADFLWSFLSLQFLKLIKDRQTPKAS